MAKFIAEIFYFVNADVATGDFLKMILSATSLNECTLQVHFLYEISCSSIERKGLGAEYEPHI